jgi:integrase
MSDHDSTAPADSGKPSKPYPEFPLFPHAAGVWAKKIRGKMHYFGPWSDPDAALAKYLEQKDALHAGRTPRPDRAALTVKDVANLFLNAKKQAVDAGELALRTFNDYKAIMDMMVEGLGKRRPVAALDAQDFGALKNKLARRNGPARISTLVQVIRCAFKFAYESGALDAPIRFGPVFKRTSKKVLRLDRAKKGPKLFSAAEVRALALGALVVGKDGPELVQAGAQLRAMILLGINAGFGNADCGNLPLSALDLDKGILDFARPKTGIPRRCCLWAETAQALREALEKRPAPKKAEHAGLVFITKYGLPWAKLDSAGPLTQEMRKLLNKLGLNGHRNFYTLRHTFRTVADEAKDQPAADYIMGHEVPHMSSVYRETISDARLRAVADQVRAWLFPAAAPAEHGGAEGGLVERRLGSGVDERGLGPGRDQPPAHHRHPPAVLLPHHRDGLRRRDVVAGRKGGLAHPIQTVVAGEGVGSRASSRRRPHMPHLSAAGRADLRGSTYDNRLQPPPRPDKAT